MLTALAAGAAAGGVSGLLNLGGSALANRWNRSNSERDASRNLKNEALYQSWYLKNLYPKQQELDYDLARRYAENSAKWEMQGLSNAGINPILAFSHGLGSAGVDYSAPSGTPSGPSGVSTSSSDAPRAPDFTEAVRDFASAELSDTQADVASGTKSSLISSAKSDAALKAKQVAIADATRRKIDAESDQINANTAKSLVDARNSLASQGMSSDFGRITARAIAAPFDKSGRALYEGIDRKLESLYRSDPVHSGNSAKAPPVDVIEVNTGKRKADFERDRQEIYRRMFLRSGR